MAVGLSPLPLLLAMPQIVLVVVLRHGAAQAPDDVVVEEDGFGAVETLDVEVVVQVMMLV